MIGSTIDDSISCNNTVPPLILPECLSIIVVVSSLSLFPLTPYFSFPCGKHPTEDQFFIPVLLKQLF